MERYRIEEFGPLTVTIHMKKRIPFLAFVTFFSLAWLAGGLLAIYSLPNSRDKGWMVLWLCFWLFAVLHLFRSLVWNLFGREKITVTEDTLDVKKTAFFPPYHRTYRVDEIRRLRVSGFFCAVGSQKYNDAYWGLAGEVIKFDCGSGEGGFGIQLDERSAEIIVGKIKNYLGAMLRSD